MCRFSSADTRCSNWSATGSLQALPVLRCETRVASSWNVTYMTESNRLSANRSPCWFWPGEKPRVICSMRAVSSSTGSMARVTTQVVAQRDTVPVLLGGPAVDPVAPGAVHAEVHRDLAVIRRQVVLGQQVLHHRHLRDFGQLGLLGIPVLAAERVEVLAVRPRDVVVRVPVLAHRQVAVDVLLDDGLKLVQKLQVGQVLRHGRLPVICTCWLQSIYLCTPVTNQVAPRCVHVRCATVMWAVLFPACGDQLFEFGTGASTSRQNHTRRSSS